MRAAMSDVSDGRATVAPGGRMPEIAARASSTSAPGLNRTSMRERRPFRPNTSCAAAMSMAPASPPPDASIVPPTTKVASDVPAWTASSSPVASPSRASVAGDRYTRSGRRRSSAVPPRPTSAGVTAAARNTSTPARRSDSSRPGSFASISTTGEATATESSRAIAG